MRPVMLLVAGPPGSGKSSLFPVRETGFDYFNVDDAAAVLNGGSYRFIPSAIRVRANRQCEEFISCHIRDRESFAVETTLGTDTTFEQATHARAKGFSFGCGTSRWKGWIGISNASPHGQRPVGTLRQSV